MTQHEAFSRKANTGQDFAALVAEVAHSEHLDEHTAIQLALREFDALLAYATAWDAFAAAFFGRCSLEEQQHGSSSP